MEKRSTFLRFSTSALIIAAGFSVGAEAFTDRDFISEIAAKKYEYSVGDRDHENHGENGDESSGSEDSAQSLQCPANLVKFKKDLALAKNPTALNKLIQDSFESPVILGFEGGSGSAPPKPALLGHEGGGGAVPPAVLIKIGNTTLRVNVSGGFVKNYELRSASINGNEFCKN